MSATPDYVTQNAIDEAIARGLREDVGSGDVTTEATIPQGTRASGFFLAKQSGTLAGARVATRAFELVDQGVTVEWSARDGDTIHPRDRIARVEGPARSLLVAERLALNFLQRMSGIATATAEMAAEIADFPARLLDTRKTAPGLRLMDKWAVALGGGYNHRVGLYDMILIKDNHIVAAGGIARAIERASDFGAERSLRIEIEASTIAEVEEILRIGRVHRLLLDNMARSVDGSFDTSMLRSAVQLVDGSFETEASGNVSLETVRSIAATGVDFISVGALTHSVRALDISLKLDILT